jgi:D-3-phosphoglycerate dehydrogenase
MAFLSYVDRPGVIGAFGRLLGDAGVNIAGMQVSRDSAGRRGSRGAHPRLPEIPAEVLTAIGNEVNATLARVADLDD